MRDLSLRAPVALAVAEGATTPTGLLGARIWSTTAGKTLEWGGSSWTAPAGSGGGNQITVSADAPSSPTLNQLWLDIS